MLPGLVCRLIAAEIDLRGYVPAKGYARAIAHAADLFYALANSRYVGPGNQRRILDCIANKLGDGANGVYLYNEDSRIARAIQGIFGQNMLTVEQIKEWLGLVQRCMTGHILHHDGSYAIGTVTPSC